MKGDKVFGYAWRSQKEKAHQEYATVPENLMGLVPWNVKVEAAVAVPNNFVSGMLHHTSERGGKAYES